VAASDGQPVFLVHACSPPKLSAGPAEPAMLRPMRGSIGSASMESPSCFAGGEGANVLTGSF